MKLYFFLCCSTSSGGQLIFVDTGDMSIMSKPEHPDLSDVEWDPTGRYVGTSVNLWSAKVY
jgi:translation initiation factor 3 subunit B